MLSNILRPYLTRRRKEYTTDSLTSSLEISSRLFSSSPNDRSRALPMRFSQRWRDASCAVMKWYNEQTSTSTEFSSVEHRRELRAPFYHEYLLIHLADGAICRLERMGGGSRADAIRSVGCLAHDTIQWFSEGTYSNHPISQEPSELVVRVEFPQAIDLLDVLAICYSVQQVKRSSTYTLQRYNCYFLCSAVLNILARRTTIWAGAFTENTWNGIVDDAVHKLQKMEFDDAYGYLGLGICSLINSDFPVLERRKFILDALREALSHRGLSELNTEIFDTLWFKDLELATHTGLLAGVKAAIELALKCTSTCAMRMKQLLSKDTMFESTKTIMTPKFQRKVTITLVNQAVKSIKTAAKSAAATYAMKQVEDQTSFSNRLHTRLVATKKSIYYGIWDVDDCEYLDLSDCSFLTRAQVAIRLVPAFVAEERINLIRALGGEDAGYWELEPFSHKNDMHTKITTLYEHVLLPLCGTRDAALSVLDVYFGVKEWAHSFGVCVGRVIEEGVYDRCSPVGQITIFTPTFPNGSRMNLAKFQDYTLKRIHDHAQRVASVGLAAASIVQNDIERAMSDVWLNMPDDHNRTRSRNRWPKRPWETPSKPLRRPATPFPPQKWNSLLPVI
ncbi:hypothetical protein B0J17DRAFT_632115 [Rhizoctonia solani]|nr:hypothetical protein B0J17DRAFT_632115 [Rhizoctonia solani]